MKEYVIQEKEGYDKNWYDHPDIRPFRNLEKAKEALRGERKESDYYSYRLLERIETVIIRG